MGLHSYREYPNHDILSVLHGRNELLLMLTVGAIRCGHESDVDISRGIHNTTAIHQLPTLLLHQPAIPSTGEMVTMPTVSLVNAVEKTPLTCSSHYFDCTFVMIANEHLCYVG